MTREEAIRELREDKALYETDNCHAGDGSPDGDLLEALDMAIEALSAEDEQGGTWRDGFGFAHCSICGKGVPRAIGEQTPFNFCPYCGARMRNEK